MGPRPYSRRNSPWQGHHRTRCRKHNSRQGCHYRVVLRRWFPVSTSRGESAKDGVPQRDLNGRRLARLDRIGFPDRSRLAAPCSNKTKSASVPPPIPAVLAEIPAQRGVTSRLLRQVSQACQKTVKRSSEPLRAAMCWNSIVLTRQSRRPTDKEKGDETLRKIGRFVYDSCSRHDGDTERSPCPTLQPDESGCRCVHHSHCCTLRCESQKPLGPRTEPQFAMVGQRQRRGRFDAPQRRRNSIGLGRENSRSNGQRSGFFRHTHRYGLQRD